MNFWCIKYQLTLTNVSVNKPATQRTVSVSVTRPGQGTGQGTEFQITCLLLE